MDVEHYFREKQDRVTKAERYKNGFTPKHNHLRNNW